MRQLENWVGAMLLWGFFLCGGSACSPHHDPVMDGRNRFEGPGDDRKKGDSKDREDGDEDGAEPERINFQFVFERIFKPHCLACHSEAPTESNQGFFLILSDYERADGFGIINNSRWPETLIPGRPLQSGLYLTMVEGNPQSRRYMPPMWHSSGRNLSAEQRTELANILFRWIELGAPEL